MWAYRKTIRVNDVGDAKDDIAQAERMTGFLTGVVTKSLVEGAPYVIHFYFEDVGQGARWAQDLKRVSLSPESLEDWGLEYATQAQNRKPD
jgi:hypothetical protein